MHTTGHISVLLPTSVEAAIIPRAPLISNELSVYYIELGSGNWGTCL